MRSARGGGGEETTRVGSIREYQEIERISGVRKGIVNQDQRHLNGVDQPKGKRRAQGQSICDHAMTDVEKTTKGKAARSEPRLVSGIQGVLGE